MSDLRAAAQQALEALEFDGFTPEDETHRSYTTAAITALRAALEQPVAWLRREELADLQNCNYRHLGADSPRIWAPYQADVPDPEQGLVPVYTHPPRREWRGLKEWEINDGLDQLPTEDVCSWSFRKGVYFAEAALKERNHE